MFSALSDGKYIESTYSTVGRLSTAVATSHSSAPSASRATAARPPGAAVSSVQAMGGGSPWDSSVAAAARNLQQPHADAHANATTSTADATDTDGASARYASDVCISGSPQV